MSMDPQSGRAGTATATPEAERNAPPPVRREDTSIASDQGAPGRDRIRWGPVWAGLGAALGAIDTSLAFDGLTQTDVEEALGVASSTSTCARDTPPTKAGTARERRAA